MGVEQKHKRGYDWPDRDGARADAGRTSGIDVAHLFSRIGSAGRSAVACGAIAALLSASGVAQARDNGGVAEFFQQVFGGGGGDGGAMSQPGMPSFDGTVSRPLTVRPRKHRRPVESAHLGPRELASTEKVTIYTDKTLEPGDAVMTEKGMRIFNGSESWPYKEADFGDVSTSRRIAPSLRKQLKAIDVASRQ